MSYFLWLERNVLAGMTVYITDKTFICLMSLVDMYMPFPSTPAAPPDSLPGMLEPTCHTMGAQYSFLYQSHTGHQYPFATSKLSQQGIYDR